MPVLNPPTAGRQRGVATLAIVSILFFIVALVAAYTNRNLIFEQRTSGNQWRSTMALEAAEGGVEWVLSQLNSGRIDSACLPSDDVSQAGFAERYLVTDAAGNLTPVADRAFGCVADGDGGWSCSCPDDASPTPTAPTGTGVYPAFRGRFVASSRPGAIRVEVNGCTRLDDQCLQFPAAAVANEGRAWVQVLLALRNAVPAAPVAAVTARGSVTVDGTLSAYSPDSADGSFAILAGGAVTTGAGGTLNVGAAAGSPGDPARLVVDGDLPLQSLPGPAARSAAERMFASVFTVWPEAYRDQPGAVVLDCSGGCDGDVVRNAAALYPGRVLWIDGDVALDGLSDIGSPTAPVVLVVDGAPSIETTVYGLVYVRETVAGVAWDATGTGTLRGALVVEGSMAGDAALTVVHDADVLSALRRGTGSFVRVPGGWADFTR